MGTEDKPTFVKTPCLHCPFRRDVQPFLTPQRGDELAYHTENHYNEFPCHKTTVPDENGIDNTYGEKTLECAGFLSMVYYRSDRKPEGFEPSKLVYSDAMEMSWAYEDIENWKDLQ